jgi:hypothetical protein
MNFISSIRTAHHELYRVQLESGEKHWHDERIVAELRLVRKYNKIEVHRKNRAVSILCKERTK